MKVAVKKSNLHILAGLIKMAQNASIDDTSLISSSPNPNPDQAPNPNPGPNQLNQKSNKLPSEVLPPSLNSNAIVFERIPGSVSVMKGISDGSFTKFWRGFRGDVIDNFNRIFRPFMSEEAKATDRAIREARYRKQDLDAYRRLVDRRFQAENEAAIALGQPPLDQEKYYAERGLHAPTAASFNAAAWDKANERLQRMRDLYLYGGSSGGAPANIGPYGPRAGWTIPSRRPYFTPSSDYTPTIFT